MERFAKKRRKKKKKIPTKTRYPFFQNTPSQTFSRVLMHFCRKTRCFSIFLNSVVCSTKYATNLIHLIPIIHYVKSVCVRSYSGRYFPTFGLNTERYGVFRYTEYSPYLSVFSPNVGKYGPRITPNTDIFYEMICIVCSFSLA